MKKKKLGSHSGKFMLTTLNLPESMVEDLIYLKERKIIPTYTEALRDGAREVVNIFSGIQHLSNEDIAERFKDLENQARIWESLARQTGWVPVYKQPKRKTKKGTKSAAIAEAIKLSRVIK